MIRFAVAALSGLVLLTASVTSGDEIVVKGKRVDGTVVGVSADGVNVDTAYGDGIVSIPWADLDTIQTDGSFVVLHGDDGMVKGRLTGVQDGQVQFGSDRVPAGDIFKGFTEADYADSTWRRLKAQYRHWTGTLGVNGALTMATTDTSNFGIHWDVERRKSPTRLIASFDYLTTDQKTGSGQDRLDNELRGLMRGEYDLTDRIFAYASFAGDYDQIERLNFRGVPKLGLGYRLWQGEKGELNVDAGGSYVYENYFSDGPLTPDSHQDYWGVAFGADGYLDLPYGAKLTGRVEYLPSVTAWTDNYLVRGTVGLGVPLLEWLSLNFSLYDEYNNAPAEGAFKNKLTVTGGLGATF